MQNTGLFVVIIIWIFHDAHVLANQSRCQPLFMCPTFCMKMKNGCYVCNCGSFSDYMKSSANEISRVSNEQSPQTGSQLSTYTSGYDVDVEPQQTGTGTGFLDYRTMFRSAVSAITDRKADSNKRLDDEGMQQYVLHNGGIVNPDFTRSGQRSGTMPGMSCSPVSRYCAASCLTTDAYTGCIQCTCDVINNAEPSKPGELNEENPSSPTVNAPSRKQNLTSKSPWEFELPNALIPFKIPTPAPIQVEQRVPTLLPTMDLVSKDQNTFYYNWKMSTIKVPTLPPIPNQHSMQMDVTDVNLSIQHLSPNNEKANKTNLQPLSVLSHIPELDHSGGEANHDHIHDKQIELPYSVLSENRFDESMTRKNDIDKQARPPSAHPLLQSPASRSGPLNYYDDNKDERQYEMATVIIPILNGLNAVNKSNEENREEHLHTLSHDDDHIFEFLNEVIDNNEVPTGGFFGNTINRGVSLQELTHNGEDTVFDQEGIFWSWNKFDI